MRAPGGNSAAAVLMGKAAEVYAMARVDWLPLVLCFFDLGADWRQ
jgi:hypothetical protein